MRLWLLQDESRVDERTVLETVKDGRIPESGKLMENSPQAARNVLLNQAAFAVMFCTHRLQNTLRDVVAVTSQTLRRPLPDPATDGGPFLD